MFLRRSSEGRPFSQNSYFHSSFLFRLVKNKPKTKNTAWNCIKNSTRFSIHCESCRNYSNFETRSNETAEYERTLSMYKKEEVTLRNHFHASERSYAIIRNLMSKPRTSPPRFSLLQTGKTEGTQFSNFLPQEFRETEPTPRKIRTVRPSSNKILHVDSLCRLRAVWVNEYFEGLPPTSPNFPFLDRKLTDWDPCTVVQSRVHFKTNNNPPTDVWLLHQGYNRNKSGKVTQWMRKTPGVSWIH